MITIQLLIACKDQQNQMSLLLHQKLFKGFDEEHLHFSSFSYL